MPRLLPKGRVLFNNGVSVCGGGNWTFTDNRMELDLQLTLSTKINSK